MIEKIKDGNLLGKDLEYLYINLIYKSYPIIKNQDKNYQCGNNNQNRQGQTNTVGDALIPLQNETGSSGNQKHSLVRE